MVVGFLLLKKHFNFNYALTDLNEIFMMFLFNQLWGIPKVNLIYQWNMLKKLSWNQSIILAIKTLTRHRLKATVLVMFSCRRWRRDVLFDKAIRLFFVMVFVPSRLTVTLVARSLGFLVAAYSLPLLQTVYSIIYSILTLHRCTKRFFYLVLLVRFKLEFILFHVLCFPHWIVTNISWKLFPRKLYKFISKIRLQNNNTFYSWHWAFTKCNKMLLSSNGLYYIWENL